MKNNSSKDLSVIEILTVEKVVRDRIFSLKCYKSRNYKSNIFQGIESFTNLFMLEFYKTELNIITECKKVALVKMVIASLFENGPYKNNSTDLKFKKRKYNELMMAVNGNLKFLHDYPDYPKGNEGLLRFILSYMSYIDTPETKLTLEELKAFTKLFGFNNSEEILCLILNEHEKGFKIANFMKNGKLRANVYFDLVPKIRQY